MKYRGQLSQYLLFVYIFIAIAFYATELASVAKLLGALLAGIFIMEISILRIKFSFPPIFFGYILLIIISVPTVMFHFETYNRFETMLQVFILFLLTFNIVKRTGKISIVTYPIILAVFYLIFQQILGGRALIEQGFSDRVETNMGDQNDYAFLLTAMIAFGILQYLFLISVRKIKGHSYDTIRSSERIIFSVFFVIAAILASIEIVLYTGSKTGLATLAVTIIALIVLILKEAPITFKIFSLVTFTIAITSLYQLLISSPHFQRVLYFFLFLESGKASARDQSSKERYNMIVEALELWLERPIIGHGLDRFQYISSFPHFSHNNYTEILCNFGVIGLVLFYAFHVFVFVKVKKLLKNKRINSILPYWLLFLLFLLLIRDLTIVNYYSKVYFILLGTLMGIVVHLNKIPSIRENNRNYS